MKSVSYKIDRKKQWEQVNRWDSFINHIDSLYFSGAAELLDKKTIAFEYEHFRNYFS